MKTTITKYTDKINQLRDRIKIETDKTTKRHIKMELLAATDFLSILRKYPKAD